MVASAIDPTLNYSEVKTVNLNDTKMQSELYQIMIFGINLIIAVGSSKQTNKNITYFPIYLVKSDDRVIQIGVYEFLTTVLPKYINQTTYSVDKDTNSTNTTEIIPGSTIVEDTQTITKSLFNSKMTASMEIDKLFVPPATLNSPYIDLAAAIRSDIDSNK